jgi:hypothetical protein
MQHGCFQPRRSRWEFTRAVRNAHPRVLRAGLQKDRHPPSWLFSRFLGDTIPLYSVGGAALGTTQGGSCGDIHARRKHCYNEKHFRKNSGTRILLVQKGRTYKKADRWCKSCDGRCRGGGWSGRVAYVTNKARRASPSEV